MMYAGGMPSLTAQLRLERLPGLDVPQVRLTPHEAAQRVGVSPLWDAGMIALCLGGLASSGIGLFLGLRRLRRVRIVPAGSEGRFRKSSVAASAGAPLSWRS
jgi:hypothetical protein